jgi:hypothetical protein
MTSEVQRGHGRLWPCAFGAFAFVGSITAWYQMHSKFQSYDDEGFLLLTLKHFLDGHKLYDEIFTFYGPFYYAYQALLYRVTGLAISHDAVRLFSVIPWTVVPLLAAWIVYRACRSMALAAVTHLAVSASLSFFTWEPGQPQELCILLFVLLAGVLLLTGRGPATAAVAGLLVAMLALCKVNAGVFGALAVGLTLLLRTRPGILRNVLLAGLLAATALMPAMLMKPFHGTWVRQWLFVSTATIGGALMISLRQRSLTPVALRDCVMAATASLAGVALVVAPFLLRGTSLTGMVHMLIFRVSGGATQFEIPVSFNWLSMVSAAAALLVSAAYFLRFRRRVVFDAIFAPKLVFGVFVLGAGVLDHGKVIFLYASPWVWLVGVDEMRESNPAGRRAGICLLSAIQTLWAFPVAAHMHFVTILLIISAAICLSDCLPELRSRIGGPLQGLGRGRAATTAICLAVLAGHLYNLQAERSNYRSMVSLDLPGARSTHVWPVQYHLYHWTVNEIHQNCSGFMTMPGMNSFYFWAQQDSPTLVNLTNWVGALDDAEQQQMTTDFARVTRPCVVLCPSVVKFWLQGRSLPPRPLARWIEEHFQQADAFGSCQLLTWKRP